MPSARSSKRYAPKWTGREPLPEIVRRRHSASRHGFGPVRYRPTGELLAVVVEEKSAHVLRVVEVVEITPKFRLTCLLVSLHGLTEDRILPRLPRRELAALPPRA